MNVAIIAIGEDGLEVDVCLGSHVRKTHEVAGGDSIELAVAGNQNLNVRKSSEVAPTAEAEGDLPVGADVKEEGPTAEDQLNEGAVIGGGEPGQPAEVAEVPAAEEAVAETEVSADQIDLFDNPFAPPEK